MHLELAMGAKYAYTVEKINATATKVENPEHIRLEVEKEWPFLVNSRRIV